MMTVLVVVALLVMVLLLLGLCCYGQFEVFFVRLGASAIPGNKYFVWSKLVVSLGGFSTGSCAGGWCS